MTLIKDLIDIPERVQKGDYVLKLVEDIKRPDVVLGNYVVTPELAKNFDAALTFIRSALAGPDQQGDVTCTAVSVRARAISWPSWT